MAVLIWAYRSPVDAVRAFSQSGLPYLAMVHFLFRGKCRRDAALTFDWLAIPNPEGWQEGCRCAATPGVIRSAPKRTPKGCGD